MELILQMVERLIRITAVKYIIVAIIKEKATFLHQTILAFILGMLNVITILLVKKIKKFNLHFKLLTLKESNSTIFFFI